MKLFIWMMKTSWLECICGGVAYLLAHSLSICTRVTFSVKFHFTDLAPCRPSRVVGNCMFWATFCDIFVKDDEFVFAKDDEFIFVKDEKRIFLL